MKLFIGMLLAALISNFCLAEAQDIKPLSTLGTHDGAVYSLAISPDETTLISGSWDKTARLWRLKNGSRPITLNGHNAQIFSVSFSPDSKTAATASWDKTIKLWNVSDGKLLRSLDVGTLASAVAFAPDGKALASGDYRMLVTLWNVDDGEKIASFKGHTSDVTFIAYHPAGKMLASGSSDKEIKLWDLSEQKEVATLRGHEGAIRGLAYSPDGKLLASAGELSVKIWDTETNAEIVTLDKAGAAVAFSGDGKLLAMGSYETPIRIVDAQTGTVVARLVGHSGSVHSLAFTPDSRTLFSASGDRSVKQWRIPISR